MPRQVCNRCDRPESVCLCSALPQSSESVLSPWLRVVLLQHPQERKQKHQSAPFLLHTLQNVHVVVGRKLPEPSGAGSIELTASSNSSKMLQEKGVLPAGSSSTKLELDPARTLLLWPGEDAVGAVEVGANSNDFDTVLAIDATWKYAAEMAKSCPVLRGLRKVKLGGLGGGSGAPVPAFLVRKPEKIGSSKNGGGEDEEPTVGYSTAEAVAVLLDQIASARSTKKEGTPPEKSFYDVVAAPLKLYVELQLRHTGGAEGVKHRPERPGYVKGMIPRDDDGKIRTESPDAKRRKVEEKS